METPTELRYFAALAWLWLYFLHMVAFCKYENCPTSESLLEFQRSSAGGRAGDQAIRKHIANCDFCAAEVEFYSFFPQSDEKVHISKIPPPVFDVAVALLKRHKGNRSLEELAARNGFRQKKN
jgi:hypothetical protein